MQVSSHNYSGQSIQSYKAGVAFQNQKRYELAAQKYIQAIKLQPHFVEAKDNLGIVYQDLAWTCYSKADYNKSIFYANKSLVCSSNV